MITLLDLVFIGASGLAVIHGLNNQMNIGVAIYLTGYVVFALASHTLWRLGANTSYEFVLYLSTHVASLLVIVLIVAISKHDLKQNALLTRAAKNIRPSALSATFVIWIAFQFYLLSKYGTSGAFEAEGASQNDIDYVDSSALMLVNTFGIGAALAVVVRLGVEPAFARNVLAMSTFVIFIIYTLAFGAALAGGRRTVLILAISFFITRIAASRVSVVVALKRNLAAVVLASILCLGLAWYYQEIRNNVYLPAVRSSFAEPSLSKKLEGVVSLLTPESLREYASNAEAITSPVNRSGPFDLLYSIVEGRHQFNRSTEGELTAFSIGKVIPKVFYPDKPDYDIDYIVGMRFGVTAGREFAVAAEYFQAPDYATTIMVTLFADFGWISVPLVAVLIVLAIRLSISAIGVAPASGLVVLGVMGVLFELLSTIEGSLTGLLVSMRTLMLIACAGFALRFVGLTSGRPGRTTVPERIVRPR